MLLATTILKNDTVEAKNFSGNTEISYYLQPTSAVFLLADYEVVPYATPLLTNEPSFFSESTPHPTSEPTEEPIISIPKPIITIGPETAGDIREASSKIEQVSNAYRVSSLNLTPKSEPTDYELGKLDPATTRFLYRFTLVLTAIGLTISSGIMSYLPITKTMRRKNRLAIPLLNPLDLSLSKKDKKTPIYIQDYEQKRTALKSKNYH